MKNLIEAVKAHSIDNYEKGGWDVLVECWNDEDIAKYLTESKVKNETEAIEAFGVLASVWAERSEYAKDPSP